MLKIYGVPISVHTRKVIAAVLAKGLKYELEVVVPIGPSSLPAKWETISPTGKVPAVEDGDVVIADSSSLSQGTKADRYSARVALPLIRLPPGGRRHRSVAEPGRSFDSVQRAYLESLVLCWRPLCSSRRRVGAMLRSKAPACRD